MEFPIKGVVGVLGGAWTDVKASLDSLADAAGARPEAAEAGPDAIEVRADLFDDPRAALDVLGRLPPGLPAIFTARLPSHGGRFRGGETERIGLYREALSRGAALVDAESESEAARQLAREGAPLVASHHDFGGMADASEIERLTRGMAALSPRAVKLVPTARSVADGLRMLEWIAAGRPGEPRRIGFAMGEMGLPSRVLSMAWGSPLAYGALRGPVAPGQPSVRDLKVLYRAARLSRTTRVLGVAGNPVAHSLSPHLHNPALASRGMDAVYLPFRLERLDEIEPVLDPLGIHGLSVTIPFKEEALRLADRSDEAARSSGAANTLLIERPAGGPRSLSAFNTDFEGVLAPLRRRGIEPAGISAGIIGNGGAARGAAMALIQAGASVTIYSRSDERGKPVADALGAAWLPLGRLEAGRHRLIINATPLGLGAGDPSPAPRSAFDSRTTAFDMVYDPSETPFLQAAVAAGAQAIPGRDMLIAQARVQFRLFTGAEVSHEELERSFLEGQRSRRGALAED